MLTSSQLFKKFPTFYGTRRFITEFIRTCPPVPILSQIIPNIPCTKPLVPFPSLRSYKSISPGPRHMCMFHEYTRVYSKELSAPHQTPKLDHPLSAACDFILYIFTATLHIGGCSSVCNQRMCYAVVTGTQWSWWWISYCISLFYYEQQVKECCPLHSKICNWDSSKHFFSNPNRQEDYLVDQIFHVDEGLF
jgi:hypothetical protein